MANQNRDRKVGQLVRCANCNEEHRQYLHKPGNYCSVKCSSEKRHKRKYESWISSDGTSPTATWLRKALSQRDGRKCSKCGLSEWMGIPISVEVDHIDGNAFNSDPSNVRLICPNCHAQTPTYRNRNKGNGRRSRILRGEANGNAWLFRKYYKTKSGLVT